MNKFQVLQNFTENQKLFNYINNVYKFCICSERLSIKLNFNHE